MDAEQGFPGITQSEARLLRAVGDVTRRDLLSGEAPDLPGFGSLRVVHKPSRQVGTGGRVVITAPSSVVETTPDLGGITDSILPRVSVAVDRDLDDVRSDWLSIIDRAIVGTPLPLSGLGTFRFDSGVPAFEPSEAVRAAVNARYEGYQDIQLSGESSDWFPLWNAQSDSTPAAPTGKAVPSPEPAIEEESSSAEAHLAEDAKVADETSVNDALDDDVDVPREEWPEHAVEPTATEPSEAEPPAAVTKPRSVQAAPRRTGRGSTVVAFAAVAAALAAIVFGLWYFLVREQSGSPTRELEASPVTATNPAPPADAPVEETAVPEWTRGAIDVSAGGFTIIVTSKESEDEAVSFARSMTFDTLPVDILDAVVAGQRWYRVGVGQFPSLSVASASLAQHRDSLPSGSWVGQIEQP